MHCNARLLKISYFCSGGWHFLTYTCEPIKLLPWLMKKFQSQGGKIKKRKLQTLEELKKENYDIVVNCSGLGARELVQDCLVTPVRGQVSRVINFPDIFEPMNFLLKIKQRTTLNRN